MLPLSPLCFHVRATAPVRISPPLSLGTSTGTTVPEQHLRPTEPQHRAPHLQLVALHLQIERQLLAGTGGVAALGGATASSLVMPAKRLSRLVGSCIGRHHRHLHVSCRPFAAVSVWGASPSGCGFVTLGRRLFCGVEISTYRTLRYSCTRYMHSTTNRSILVCCACCVRKFNPDSGLGSLVTGNRPFRFAFFQNQSESC